ncbi:DNA endonuclease RBBP8 isoform X1 [Neolamprologus brichardi]|uniref:DNA endonuclease RBBP8 isoform X1 n=1 Tax=Neolamprologus brichardi TaxID=32507 RepID=UPI001643AF82|nr:DNA endonuclease RBBP8 isoform X1 [Neolamprologus brichardi]XP_035769412.1 DNA endonuclease RBBP8 isoform X1 [Neolamprologus brichardi]
MAGESSRAVQQERLVGDFQKFLFCVYVWTMNTKFVTQCQSDTKRMEELFTRNQQMKEQHRLLTENIKVLENRLRAGLCDRCTVTQEVAKRRQQEFEASQIQSLQHISLLAGEMNNLKKENKKLKDENRNLKAALDKGHSDHSSNSSTTTEVKPNSSPALSPSSGILSLVNTTTSRPSNKPADGNISVKPDVELKTEETEGRQLRGINRSQFDALPLSALTLPSWKKEHFVTRAGEKRRSSVPAAGDVRPGRHVVHAPVARHPQAINSNSASLRWSLSESTDWITAGTNTVVQTSPNPHSQHFHSLNPMRQQASPRRQVFSPPFPKQSSIQPPAREPTVVFRLTNLPDYVEIQTKPTEKTEKKENLLPKVERVSGEGLKELNDGPLDLSDRGKSISSQVPKSDSSSALQDGTRVQKSPELEVNTNSSADIAESSSSPIVIPSSSCATTEEQAPDKDPNHKVVREQDQKEEVNGKTDESKGKKVPILTLSLRPAVVVLETLNPALQKQDSLSSNGKTSSATDEPETSSDEQDEEASRSGQESNQGSKRKRASVETDADRDFNTDSNNHRERKLKITMRSEEKP